MDPVTPETPVAAPDPQAAAPAAPPAAPETPVNPRLEKLKKLGFENIADENEGFDRLVTAHEQMKDQFSLQLQEALEQVRSQVPTQEPAKPAAPKKFFSDLPAVDLALVQQFRQPDGTWKENTPADIRGQFEARQRYIDGFASKLVTDPEAALAPLLEQKFAEFFDQKFGQVSQQQQEQQFFSRAYTENEWLFDKDPVSGRPTQRLSTEGQRFNDLMVEAQQEYGITNRVKAFEFAMKMRAIEKGQSATKTTTSEQTQAARTDKQQALLNRAAPGTSRSGSLPNQPTPRNPNLTPGQKLVQQLQRDGVAIG